ARRVAWIERSTGQIRSATATRTAAGWEVDTGVTLPSSAVPAELVPLIVRRDGGFAGEVFLPAREFAAGAGRIDAVAPGRLVARLAIGDAGGAQVEATIDLGRDGAPARVVDGDGVIALRASEAQADAAFPPVDLIAATAVPITGTRRTGRLVLSGELALPPLPGQAARPTAGGVEVEVDRALAGGLAAGRPGPDRSREIVALVRTVRARITPDLAAPPASPRDAARATAGDCTTFALAYAALAARRGIATRVVTGMRIDGDRLVRHRWAVSWTGRAWIAVDAAFGAAPAGGDLIGLAVHDADDAGLVAGDAALTRVRGAAWD
ncbi:MAG TPA: transglutaminase domain-containing protein, partial [Kofleriaceae bacterium]|nr:transglutaminase domain-containing protein [Kofleriaceae bacterium]